MKNIISKSNIITFGIFALCVLLFSLISCSKLPNGTLDELLKADASSKRKFSEMSLEEKEAYCENLVESKELRKLEKNARRFIPISRPALEDERFHQIKTKAELMAWIKDNLDHTLFRSVKEAEKLYAEIEQLQKIIQQKFSAFDFSEGSADAIFYTNYTIKRAEEQKVSHVTKNHPQAKGTHCLNAFNNCLYNSQQSFERELAVCTIGGVVSSCIPGIGAVTGPLTYIICASMAMNAHNRRVAKCEEDYRNCR